MHKERTMIKKQLLLCLAICVMGVSFAANAGERITIFAAASLTNAIQEIAAEYEKEKAVKVQTSFAASSTLAKQIEQGAPADIYMSADTKWMSYLQEKGLIDAGSKTNLLGNHLVLIAPKGKVFKVEMDKNFNFGNAFNGRLCTGETESVPVGIYAKQALKNLGWWDAVKMRLVGTQDVRAALVFVERGECAAGIVYETDARVSAKVETIALFPDASHEPVIYPLALVKGASAQAAGFYHYMKSDKAKAVFTRYGFSRI